MWIAVGILIFLVVFVLISVSAIRTVRSKQLTPFLESLGFKEVSKFSPGIQTIINELYPGVIVGTCASEMGGGDDASWIIHFDFGRGQRNSKRFLIILCGSRSFPSCMAVRHGLDVGLSQLPPLGRTMLEKIPQAGRTEFYQGLRPASGNDQESFHIPGLLLMKAKDVSLNALFTPEIMSVLREWTQNGLNGFIFYKNACLLEIVTPIPGEAPGGPLKGTVKEVLEKWCYHLQMKNKLKKLLLQSGF